MAIVDGKVIAASDKEEDAFALAKERCQKRAPIIIYIPEELEDLEDYLGLTTEEEDAGYKVGKKFPEEKRLLLTGGKATKENLLQVGRFYRFVNLLVHGQLDPKPQLLLAGGNLSIRDIFLDLRLRATLLSVFACHSGAVTVTSGDELLGLIRASLYAGARAMLVGNWIVNIKATSKLMTRFYSSLEKGLDKAEALQKAQISFITGSNSVRQHPYYWGFTLIGDPVI